MVLTKLFDGKTNVLKLNFNLVVSHTIKFGSNVLFLSYIHYVFGINLEITITQRTVSSVSSDGSE